MSVNNKRVFYVKYLPNEIYAQMLRARPDVRLDRLENDQAQALARARMEEQDKGGDAVRAALSLVGLKRRLAGR